MFSEWTSSTPIFNSCILHYSAAASYGPFDIPLHIEQYKGPFRNPKFTGISSAPKVEFQTNLAYGGNHLAFGPKELPKIEISGWMQTPTENVNNWIIPAFIRENNRLTYGDFISSAIEGRANSSDTNFSRVDPAFYRDPYGRVFDKPIIASFGCAYVEAIPCRQTFSITLLLTTGSEQGPITSL